MSELSVPHDRHQARMRSSTIIQVLRLWCHRYTQRRALAELDDERLDDLGLSRQDVTRECLKPFWA